MGTQLNVLEERFIRFYNQYFDMVYQVCFLYMKNDLDTQAMVQSTFTKYLKSKVVFLNDEHAKIWFITTGASLCSEVLKPWRQYKVQYTAYHEALCYHTAEELLTGMKDMLPKESLKEDATKEILTDSLSCIFRLPVKYILSAYLYYQEAYTAKEIGRYLNRKEAGIERILKRCHLMLHIDKEESIKIEKSHIQNAIKEIKPDIEVKGKILDNISNGNNLLEKQNFYLIYKYYISCRIIVAVSICLIIIVGSIVMWQEKDRFYISGTEVEIVEDMWVDAGEFYFSFSLQGNSIDTVVFASEKQYLKSLSNKNKVTNTRQNMGVASFFDTAKAQAFLTVEQKDGKEISIQWIPKELADGLEKDAGLVEDDSVIRSLQVKEKRDVILYQIKKDDLSIYQGGIEVKVLSGGQVLVRLLAIPNNEFQYRLKKIRAE